MAKRRTPQDKKPAVHSSMDDAEYDDDDEGPNPVPDEDGNVVVRRSATQGGDNRGKAKDTRRKPGRRR
jgi:hypothetical protein